MKCDICKLDHNYIYKCTICDLYACIDYGNWITGEFICNICNIITRLND